MYTDMQRVHASQVSTQTIKNSPGRGIKLLDRVTAVNLHSDTAAAPITVYVYSRGVLITKQRHHVTWRSNRNIRTRQELSRGRIIRRRHNRRLRKMHVVDVVLGGPSVEFSPPLTHSRTQLDLRSQSQQHRHQRRQTRHHSSPESPSGS